MTDAQSAHMITDSTDWLSTPLSSFAAIDAGLRCQVCKEFYDTPMLTSCSHTFCSRCIRRCLSQEGKCPACRASSQENQLRSNWALEELVNAFKSARDGALEYARANMKDSNGVNGSKRVRGKRKVEDAQFDVNADLPIRQTRSSSKRLRSTQESEMSVEEVENPRTTYSPLNGMTQDEDYQPEDGLVACPMCSKRMKEEAVFTHIDHCTGQSSPPPAFSLSTSPKKQISKPSNNLVPLATLGYGLLNDNALRKKLAALGISSNGSRTMMEQRHREWVTIWNSNCDAANPRKKSDLLKDLHIWEKTQGARYNHNPTPHVTDVRHKDFDREAYSEKQDLSFRELIANARKSKTKAVVPETSASSSKVDESLVNGKTLANDDVQQPEESNPLPSNVSNNSICEVGSGTNLSRDSPLQHRVSHQERDYVVTYPHNHSDPPQPDQISTEQLQQ